MAELKLDDLIRGILRKVLMTIVYDVLATSVKVVTESHDYDDHFSSGW